MEIYLPRVIAVVVTLLVATPVASVWKGPSQVVNVRSPFTATVTFQALEPDFITIRFTVLPLPGASAHPLSAVFSAAYLLRSGRVKPTGLSSGFRRVDLPIFGLYPNISNTVDVEVAHPRSVAAAFTVTIATPGWTGPFAITSRIDVVPRNGVKLDFSYFMVTGVASVSCTQRPHNSPPPIGGLIRAQCKNNTTYSSV